MANDESLQPPGTRLPARRRRAGRRPRPRNVKGAAYQFSLAIGGYPIRVFSASLLPDDTQGLWYPEAHEIYVLEDSPSAMGYADRLLHEVLHAISTLLMIEEDRLTERQTNTISTALLDTLARNPEFRTRLLGVVTTSEEAPATPEAH